MTEAEVIEELQYHIDSPFGIMVSEETCKLAINALEKQIAKKPVIINKKGLEIEYKCPVCGLYVIEMLPIEKYCRYCGQKLDSEV